ncbi:type III-B CRISPR module RAMP protein Cmr1 [Brockia lithotrophica]|uniref:CRISPR type III-B/RAMP module RAMP protein Cmr1 n=1 Tax=Brockia lithotrophica TaxID=933949 RepID=A0A660KW29_9BACL|nr:type III-B CRISPR module RAMP protein Cmr1 [Brockia lithotrophica]RKQ84652.1 CRISPR type III-B/RAMP module RAMP protein Cmr1 [Brockia lithotrophica]
MGAGEWKEWEFKALTDIWTGDANGKGNRFIPTGLMGSIRWWFEVLVRGLGGKACDPTDGRVRCPNHGKRPNEADHHCVVCELFGCTGWARKFRLMVLDENGRVIQNQIKAKQTFILRFIPLRFIREEEWCLLNATLNLISKCGAVGGRTVLKPSKEWGIEDLGKDDLGVHNNQVIVKNSRKGLKLRKNDIILKIDGEQVSSIDDIERILKEKRHGDPIEIEVKKSNGETEKIKSWAGKRHHIDFGLVKLEHSPEDINCSRGEAEKYVIDSQWRKGFDYKPFAWASLKYFWCVKGKYLARLNNNESTFNMVIGRPSEKEKSSDENSDKWIAGYKATGGQLPESKKVFSFKNTNGKALTFGFVNPKEKIDPENMKSRLKDAWGDEFNPDIDFLTVDQILGELFNHS